MKMTKQLWGKTNGRQYKHYVQSFPPDENITPEQAHELARELCAERFKGFETLIATHKDREHIHSHIIVNSVNFENGKKIQESADDLQAFKDLSDELCRERGFSICRKNDEVTAYTKDKYQVLERAITGEYKSYVLDCYTAVRNAKSKAKSRDDFIELLRQEGYETNWSDTRKYITFTDGDGHKIRNINLEKTFKEPFGKEQLEHEFKSNFGRARATEIDGEGGAKTKTGIGFSDMSAATGTSAFMGSNHVVKSGGKARNRGQIPSDFAVRDDESNLQDFDRFYERYASRNANYENRAIETVATAKRVQKRSCNRGR